MFPKSKRIEDRRLLDAVKEKICIIGDSTCSRDTKSDPDHIITKGSGGDDVLRNVWPLCRAHHTERHKLGIVTFAYRYNSALEELERRGFDEIVSEARRKIKDEVKF